MPHAKKCQPTRQARRWRTQNINRGIPRNIAKYGATQRSKIKDWAKRKEKKKERTQKQTAKEKDQTKKIKKKEKKTNAKERRKRKSESKKRRNWHEQTSSGTSTHLSSPSAAHIPCPHNTASSLDALHKNGIKSRAFLRQTGQYQWLFWCLRFPSG